MTRYRLLAGLLACGAVACGNSVTTPFEEPAGNAAPNNGGDPSTAPPASDDGPSTETPGETPGDAGPNLPSDPDGPVTPPITTRSKANIFFSGHSLIDNPMPDFVAAIAEAQGDTNDWEQQNVLGSPIRVRTRGGNANGSGWDGYSDGKNRDGDGMNVLGELASPSRLAAGERYDTLVITERHDPLDTMQWENTLGYLRDYHDRLTDASPAARTRFYQCWPDIDKDDPTRWTAYVRAELAVWECAASKLNRGLGQSEITVIPAAVVLARVVEEALAGRVPGVSGSTSTRMNAIFTDNVHLTEVGAYAMGAAIYASVYGKSPVGADASNGLSAATTAALEAIAWDVVASYPASERSERDLAACRTTVARDVCPEYYAIRGRDGTCDYWTSSDSPLRWPDDSIPIR